MIGCTSCRHHIASPTPGTTTTGVRKRTGGKWEGDMKRKVSKLVFYRLVRRKLDIHMGAFYTLIEPEA